MTLLNSARRLRKTMTPQEVKLWVRLREWRGLGFHFRRQSPIPPYVVDFECRRWRLIVEVDGGQHNVDAHQQRDDERDVELRHLGYEVLRFWNHEVDREPDAVLATIHARLVARRAEMLEERGVSSPSPTGEGAER